MEFHYIILNTIARMASISALYTGEEVLSLLDIDEEEVDCDDGLDDVLFPGSDNELGFLEEIETDDEFVRIDAEEGTKQYLICTVSL